MRFPKKKWQAQNGACLLKKPHEKAEGHGLQYGGSLHSMEHALPCPISPSLELLRPIHPNFTEQEKTPGSRLLSP